MRLGLAVFTLFGALFLATADYQVVLAILPRIESDFGVSTPTVGLLMSGYALFAGIFSLVLGPWTDRHGRRVFLLLGLMLVGLCAAGAWLTRSFSMLLLFRALAGLAGGSLSVCTAAYVADVFPSGSRGRIMGIVLSSYFAALIFGVPVGAWIEENWGWRQVFLLSGSTALVLTVLALWLPREVRERPRNTRLYSSYPRLLGNRRARAALWVSFGISGGTLAFLTFAPPHLSSAFGLGSLEISRVFQTAGVGALAGAPVAGWLCDHLGRRRVFLGANTLLAIPLVAVATVGWGALLIALFFLVSLGISFRQTALQTLQAEMMSSAGRGAYLALRTGFSQVGIAVSVALAGYLYALRGYGAVLILSAALTLAASLVFFARVPEASPDQSVLD